MHKARPLPGKLLGRVSLNEDGQGAVSACLEQREQQRASRRQAANAERNVAEQVPALTRRRRVPASGTLAPAGPYQLS